MSPDCHLIVTATTTAPEEGLRTQPDILGTRLRVALLSLSWPRQQGQEGRATAEPGSATGVTGKGPEPGSATGATGKGPQPGPEVLPHPGMDVGPGGMS